MRVITLLAMMGVILIVSVSIAVGYVFFVAGGQQQSGASQQKLIDACQGVKEVRCNQGGISEGDYPSNCIQNGEHVLDNPYTCPG